MGGGPPRSVAGVRAWWLGLALLVGCREQIVVLPDGGGGGGVDRGAPITGQDAGPRPDAGAEHDAGPRQGAACFVDPFANCSDPAEQSRTNDSWADAASFHTTSVGCIRGDELTTLAGDQLGILCQTEPADYFALTVVPCDTRTLRMQVRLHPLTECPGAEYALALLFGGGLRACGDTFDGQRIECSEEGPDRIIRLLIPPGNTVQPWYFGVVSDHPDVRFEYALEASIQ